MRRYGLPHPAVRPVDGLFEYIIFRGGRRAFIQRHHDIRTEVLLDLYHFSRGELYLSPVYMRAEKYTVTRYFSHFSEAVYLIPAAICKYRAIPVHEFMQPTRFCDKLVTGPDMQMVGIGEDYLGIELMKLPWGNRFDGCLRPHRHEYRRLYLAVSRFKSGYAGFIICL